MWILYNYGGLYFDTDVEVIKGLDDIICNGNFMGEESDEGHLDAYDGLGINPGLGLGVSPKNKTIKLILEPMSMITYTHGQGKLPRILFYVLVSA